ncbi:metal-dependent transcriptional regulator [Pseudonocardia acaciae]|uniref:metal-dependent transcriptional regulator n=1 Tax=Pseudonocardia acaciae TaxID=551276 RepID=UPI000A02AB56|nr:metal-dependent transcriptional regulator [Pseudonocardia acaciae]
MSQGRATKRRDHRSPSCCQLTHTDAVEDTLRTIFVLSGRGEPASTSAVAEELQVTAPTVSTMLKRLVEHGLVERTGDHGVLLTEHGREHAQRVVRAHRLLETFLVRQLGMSWDEVHDEADLLEHALSDRLMSRLDNLLEHPTSDPHGDPIPPSRGGHEERWGQRLDSAGQGARFQVERVYDRDSDALRYLAELGVRPGVTITVLERAPFGGPLWIELDEHRIALGDPLTRLVHGRTL